MDAVLKEFIYVRRRATIVAQHFLAITFLADGAPQRTTTLPNSVGAPLVVYHVILFHGHGTGGTPYFTTGFEPLARDAPYLTGQTTLGDLIRAA